jgi:crotonobetainyl-CoA:carnitine CoA-transferase CaiB-like acyl-CoA transferase
VIAAWTAARPPQEAVAALQAAGVPSAVVTPARDLLANPQLQARRFFETLDRAVVGTVEMPALPIQLADPHHQWLRRSAPTLGEHNPEILGELLGLTGDQITELAEANVIGTRPAGL